MIQTFYKSESGIPMTKFEFDDYTVELTKSKNSEDYHPIVFVFKGKLLNHSSTFYVDWDSPENGGRIEIEYEDRWGSIMNFTLYSPSSPQKMFDTILFHTTVQEAIEY